MHWYCEECNEEAISAVKTAELIKTKCMQYISELDELLKYTANKRDELKKEIHQELETIREEIKEVKKENNKKDRQTEIDQELETIRKEIKGVKKEVQETSIVASAEKNLKEMELRESKKLNLVLFNVEESNAITKDDSAEDDKVKLSKIQEELNTSANFSNFTRLGAKSQNKTRPLKVTVSHMAEHRSILKVAKNLRKSKKFSSVYISRDMAPLEREAWKKLGMERKEKQEDSDTKQEEMRWIIFKGEVIKEAPRRDWKERNRREEQEER
eukprot:gene19676-21622_t